MISYSVQPLWYGFPGIGFYRLDRPTRGNRPRSCALAVPQKSDDRAVPARPIDIANILARLIHSAESYDNIKQHTRCEQEILH